MFLSYNAPAWRKPFGFCMDNGLNFAKSIHDPNSVVRRILKVVEDSPTPLTKREILTKLGYKLNIRKKNTYKTYPQYRSWYDSDGHYHYKGIGTGEYKYTTYHVPRGYLCWYFSGMRKAGFIFPIRKGRTQVWVKEFYFPRSELVVNTEAK